MTDVLHLRGDHRDLLGTEIVAARYDPDRDTTEITCGVQPAVQPARGLTPIDYALTDLGLAALAADPAGDLTREPSCTDGGGRGRRCYAGRER